MTARARFDAAEFALTLATTPHAAWPSVIAGDARKQKVADSLLAVVARAPALGPEQRAIVRGVFRRATSGSSS